MDPSVLRFLILAAVFGAVMLLVEGLVSYIQSSRHQSRAMNKRMELIARGMSREQIMTQLRRVSESSNLPGFFGNIIRMLETGLVGAGLRLRAGTLLLYLTLAALGLFVIA